MALWRSPSAFAHGVSGIALRRTAEAFGGGWLGLRSCAPSSSSSSQRSLKPPTGTWNQFRGNAQLTGIADVAPPASLSVKWTYDAGDAIDSSPAIADNVVYIGSAKGELLAIDLASGKLRWKYATGSSIGESSPAVSADAVFVGDLDGTVHAVNVRDGSRLWTFKTASEIKSSPTLAEDLV